MTRPEELALVGRILSGETELFEELMRPNERGVYNLALRMTGSEQDALDMSQEAFLKAFTSLPSFRGESKFSVWLYRVTSNVCLDFLRRKKRHPADSITLLDADGGETELEIPDERFSPESEAERRELREAVRLALLELPPDMRQILLLREISGLSYAEIGEALSLEEGTVKSRIFRARKKLCSILGAYGNISAPAASKTRKAAGGRGGALFALLARALAALALGKGGARHARLQRIS